MTLEECAEQARFVTAQWTSKVALRHSVKPTDDVASQGVPAGRFSWMPPKQGEAGQGQELLQWFRMQRREVWGQSGRDATDAADATACSRSFR